MNTIVVFVDPRCYHNEGGFLFRSKRRTLPCDACMSTFISADALQSELYALRTVCLVIVFFSSSAVTILDSRRMALPAIRLLLQAGLSWGYGQRGIRLPPSNAIWKRKKKGE